MVPGSILGEDLPIGEKKFDAGLEIYNSTVDETDSCGIHLPTPLPPPP